VFLSIIHTLLILYLIILFGRIILSWFPLSPEGPMAGVSRVLYRLTEPVLAPLRAVLPPVQMGGMGLDLSPMIVTFAILILLNFLPA
jgi:YggT family protein